MHLFEWLYFLAPYQFSPTITVTTIVVPGLYLRGLRAARLAGRPVSGGRRVCFLTGFFLCYAVMHTRFDYYAQYLFFMHRLQHLVLHHAGPFLMAVAAPWQTLALGVPARVRERWLRPCWLNPVTQGIYRFLQNPVVAPVLFVGLIYFWLTPAVHFDAMLDLTLYHVMNWSMVLDGLLFWWLMLNPQARGGTTVLGYGVRIVILFVIMLPQIVIGAYIALSGKDLYPIYSVCGRAWPIAASTDQQLGGLLTWIPAAMMSVLGILVVIKLMMKRDRQVHANLVGSQEFGASGSGR